MTYLMEKLSMSASLLANPHSSMASRRRVEFDRIRLIAKLRAVQGRVAAGAQKWRWTGADGAKMLLRVDQP